MGKFFRLSLMYLLISLLVATLIIVPETKSFASEKPSVLTGLKELEIGDKFAEIIWEDEKNKSKDIKAYNVYLGSFKEQVSGYKNRHILQNLSPNKKYTVSITAVNWSNVESDRKSFTFTTYKDYYTITYKDKINNWDVDVDINYSTNSDAFNDSTKFIHNVKTHITYPKSGWDDDDGIAIASYQVGKYDTFNSYFDPARCTTDSTKYNACQILFLPSSNKKVSGKTPLKLQPTMYDAFSANLISNRNYKFWITPDYELFTTYRTDSNGKRYVTPRGYHSKQDFIDKKPSTPKGYHNTDEFLKSVDLLDTYINKTKKSPALMYRAGEKIGSVEWDIIGFPIFPYEVELSLDSLRVNYKDTDYNQFNALDEELYKRCEKGTVKQEICEKRKTDYTWHHHQVPGRMQLVKKYYNNKISHVGGRELWGGGAACREKKCI
ncbi:hypothetical protein J2T17_006344 [Paenibacillus mucilaginosus]|uniref:HNH endonuclease n=1 Tax=Paenibacillus mucilaginosus TaxID=61624 RepID=UPI003D1A24F4